MRMETVELEQREAASSTAPVEAAPVEAAPSTAAPGAAALGAPALDGMVESDPLRRWVLDFADSVDRRLEEPLERTEAFYARGGELVSGLGRRLYDRSGVLRLRIANSEYYQRFTGARDKAGVWALEQKDRLEPYYQSAWEKSDRQRESWQSPGGQFPGGQEAAGTAREQPDAYHMSISSSPEDSFIHKAERVERLPHRRSPARDAVMGSPPVAGLGVIAAELRRPGGMFALTSLFMALGLLLVSLAFRASVSSLPEPEWAYWLGLSLLVGAASARLAGTRVSRRERLLLVLMLGMGLYLVKVMHSPDAFTYSDELVHHANVQQSLTNGRLFGENSILTVTPQYPGLPAATAAISSLTRLSIFASGILVIGVARLLITLGLFLIYERLTGSAWVAGLASVIYAANTNYLYWSAQFAYESLALPLAVFVIYALVMRQARGLVRPPSPALAAGVIGIAAVTVTHHLSSFALTALLWGTFLVAATLRAYSTSARSRLWFMAAAAVGAGLFWNVVVAPQVYQYLYPVISRALGAGVGLLSGLEEGGRRPFESAGVVATPLWERVVAMAAVALIVLLIPFGLRVFWKRLRASALAWVLAMAALVYIPLQGLRLTGAGWETANRASEFLFVGIGLILALALISLGQGRFRLPVPAVAALVGVVLFLGGLISGWPPNLRLARPYMVGDVAVGARQVSIAPQGEEAARWSSRYLGTGNRMAADASSARLMQAYGQQYALAGREFGIRHLFLTDEINTGELEIIQKTGVRYLVFARPLSRWDQLLGLYYNPAHGLSESGAEFQQPGLADKYEFNPGVNRLLDTGYIVIYDIGELLDETAQP
jgi:hypothetical protein